SEFIDDRLASACGLAFAGARRTSSRLRNLGRCPDQAPEGPEDPAEAVPEVRPQVRDERGAEPCCIAAAIAIRVDQVVVLAGVQLPDVDPPLPVPDRASSDAAEDLVQLG